MMIDMVKENCMLVIFLFLKIVPMSAQVEKNKELLMDSICADIYSLEANNSELGKLIHSKENYAKKFCEMRNLTNYFYSYYGTFSEPLYVKDYISGDGCYITIYRMGDMRCYMFKQLCSKCSSLLCEESENLQREMGVFSKWDLENMNMLRKRTKGDKGLTQIFKVTFGKGNSYKMQSITYHGFYISVK